MQHGICLQLGDELEHTGHVIVTRLDLGKTERSEYTKFPDGKYSSRGSMKDNQWTNPYPNLVFLLKETEF